MKLIKPKKGYSLIELTIVVGLLSILSITISAIVLTTISSSSRIRNKVRVRQIGDYAVGQIETMIRNAREVLSCDSNNNLLILSNNDSNQTQIYLEGDQIASNSGVALTPDDITITNYDLTCLPSDSSRLALLSAGAAAPDSARRKTPPNTTLSLPKFVTDSLVK